MRLRARWDRGIVGILVTCFVTVPAPVIAQTAAPGVAQPAASAAPSAAPAVLDPLGDEARVEFEAGLAALRDERYADALQSFERSYRARRVASVALNLGITLRALGRLVEARVRFQEFLELASAAQHERYDREVTGYLADLSRRIVRVRVALVPETARFTVDGRRAMQGVDGSYTVDPGERRFGAEAEGYEPASETRSVSSGTGDLELALTLRRRAVAPPPAPTGLSTGALVGIVAGSVAGAALVTVGIYLIATAAQGPQGPAGTTTGRVIQTTVLRW